MLTKSDVVNGTMLAHCSDCHTDDGRDLKYFNYSNYSIEQRALFHGLSQTQGAQLASYIRSLNVPNPGRPWNPPYQPGAGMDSQPVQNWSAGAGIGSVLGQSSDMLPYIFPSGLSTANTAANAADIASNKNLNLRELPTDLQLPDWNHWLPVVWPGEAFPAFLSSEAFGEYAGTGANGWNGGSFNMKHDGTLLGTSYPVAQINADFNHWELQAFLFAQGQKPSQTGGGGLAPGDSPFTPQFETNVYSISLWSRVKEWEIMQDYNMEQMGTTFRGPSVGGNPTEPRTWLTGGTFFASPAQTKLPMDADNNNAVSPTDPAVFSLSPQVVGSPTLYQMVANQWYYLQMILNSGERQDADSNPVDWGYTMGRIKDLSYASGVGGSGRLVATTIKELQQRDDGVAPNQLASGNPGFGLEAGYINILASADIGEGTWADIDAPTRAAVIGGVVQSFLNTATSKYTPAQFQAQTWPDTINPTATAAVPVDPAGGGTTLDQLYAVFPDLSLEGVDPNVVGSYRSFLASVWPNINWQNDTSTTIH